MVLNSTDQKSVYLPQDLGGSSSTSYLRTALIKDSMSFGNARAVASFSGSSENSEIPSNKWFGCSGKVQVANTSGSGSVPIGVYEVIAILVAETSRTYKCTTYNTSSSYGSVSTIDISFPSQYGSITYI